METTLDAFQTKKAQALLILQKLQAFLQQGREAGVEIEENTRNKLETALQSVSGDKLRIALVGGFSEGKTSIAAAWMEQLDKASMKISHRESSNEVVIYDVGAGFELIDTPGLFGFKEQINADTQAIEKYKDITKKYVSEAHLVLYVMNPVNPIKESHQDDLGWLFRTLNLLPRTIFVLSRFDEVADVADVEEHKQSLSIKRASVVSRLTELIGLTAEESSALAIVGVAANPFDMGVNHWLGHLEQFKALSHIATLQAATSEKIKANGGAVAIADETRKSIIRDVLTRQMPIAVATDEKLAAELARLEDMNLSLKKQLAVTDGKIVDAKVRLRASVLEYFSDLILQAQGVTMETAGEFFEREVGSEGIIVSERLKNIFQRTLKSAALEVSKIQIGFDSEVSHFNGMIKQYGKQGIDYVRSNNLINNKSVLGARDGLVNIGNMVGLDLGKYLKFKPWGASNLAKNINGVFAIAGLALEAWDSLEQAKRQEQFTKLRATMVANFGQQRAELLSLIDDPAFNETFFSDYVTLVGDVEAVRKDVAQRQQQREKFHAWRMTGEAIDVEFSAM
ncbi:LeoA/HP0731 family dynamin-like GTPase [Janthinobacterium psychrotolerans]|uniref:50S ribosome-binding GTPase n=1 Tax=Janthinobacterium psychrotolerans TaxID=1747903 RepID=A0A1A7BWP4_9BURK|nr:LeoA/HP0731 family dynamin-like GTPase [Janthinobacterium psychrotolerans]OBV37932.1 50S ribosome-binding GTPase [Janthinobacterium psychrotolerans]